MRFFFLVLLSFPFYGLGCDTGKLKFQRSVLISNGVFSSVNLEQLQWLKKLKSEIDDTCPDILDTLSLSTFIVEHQILLEVELLEAERSLIEIKNYIKPVKRFYKKTYGEVLYLMLALSLKSGKHHLAQYYANQLILEGVKLRKDVYEHVSLIARDYIGYSPAKDIDLVSKIKSDELFGKNVRRVSFGNSEVLLHYINKNLKDGNIGDVESLLTLFRADKFINKDTSYVANNLLAIILAFEVVTLVKNKESYKLNNRIKLYADKNKKHLTIENQLLVDLLKIFDENIKTRKSNVIYAKHTFLNLLSIYDVSRSIRSKPLLNLILEVLLERYSNDLSVISGVFELSQHEFISTPVSVVPKLDESNKEIYKKLIVKQQELKTIIDMGGSVSSVLQGEIFDLTDRLSKNKRSRVKSIEEVQLGLTTSDILIYAIDLSEKVALYKVNNNSFDVKVLNKSKLKKLVYAHRKSIIGRQDARTTGADLLMELELFEKIQPNLLVVTSGTLETLPISTLYNNLKNRWLVQDSNIIRLSAVSRLTKKRKKVDLVHSLLTVAPVNFYLPPPSDFHTFPHFSLTSILMDLDRLPLTKRESRILAEIIDLKHSLILDNERAVESNVKNKLKQSNWGLVSFSTHTLFPSSDIEVPYPGLAMRIDYSDKKNDSILFTDEIALMNFENSTILLAACNTANASDVGGSFNSLITSFQIAGADSVIASQWDINSAEAFSFFASVTEYMNKHKVSFQIALRKAQADMASAMRDKKDNPSYWGAWELYL